MVTILITQTLVLQNIIIPIKPITTLNKITLDLLIPHIITMINIEIPIVQNSIGNLNRLDNFITTIRIRINIILEIHTTEEEKADMIIEMKNDLTNILKAIRATLNRKGRLIIEVNIKAIMKGDITKSIKATFKSDQLLS